MKIKNIAITLTLLLTATAWGQSRELKVYHGTTVLMSKPVEEMDSIKSDGTYLTLHFAGGSQAIALTEIDSIGFGETGSTGSDTTAVDTSECVRIMWNGNTATITNPYSSRGLTITANGGNVVATATGNMADITYRLSGTSGNGSLTLATDRRFVLLMEGVNLTSPNGAAIKITTDYKGTVHLADGTTNTLKDGTASSDKGALQSKGKLVIQGGGALNVSGLAKHGIQSAGSTTVLSGTVNVLTAVKDGMNVDNFVMEGGTVHVANSTGDGIDGDQGCVVISGGELTIVCSGDDVKGLGCDSTLTISGGTVDITVSGSQSKGIKSKSDITVSGGNTTVTAGGSVVLEPAGSGYDPSYCTGLKADGSFRMVNGTLTVNCPSGNAGGRCVSTDGDIYLYGGTMQLTATGDNVKYTDSTGTYDAYVATCLKSENDILVSGGVHTLTATGRAVKCDNNFTMSGGTLTTSTSGTGFTLTGSGTSCTDGFAPACLKANGDISLQGGHLSATSTGKGGRGLVGDKTLTVGTVGATDSLLRVSVSTSGAAVNATSGGWGGTSDNWKGLPKGVKIEGNIRINSGIVTSYCSQTSGSSTGEAIETKDSLFIAGGLVEANSYDDAINAGKYLAVSGGQVWSYARGNDGMDCNGNRIDVSGGLLIVQGTEVAIDDNGDRGGKMYVSGGTVVLTGGNMGTTEATPQTTNQKAIKIGGGGGYGGSSGINPANGICIKTSDGTEVLTFKAPTVNGSGFVNAAGDTGTKPPGGSGTNKPMWFSSPSIQAGSYRYYTSPTISGGTQWHGLYSGATVTTSGNGTSTTAQ